ncbi:hypothetical protein AB0L06_20180 [Spirillospora sp. NPDC052269]
MASRRAGVPALRGLGAAAVIAVGACMVPAIPASADPTPSDSPSGTTPSPAPFGLTVAVAQDEVKAGQTATVLATVSKDDGDYSGAKVQLSTGTAHVNLDPTNCGKGTRLTATSGCDLKSVTGTSMVVRQSFTLPKAYVKKKTSVTVSVALLDGKDVKSGSGTVVFDPVASPTPTPSSPKPSPTPSDTGTPSTPKPTTSKTKTSSGGGGGTNNNSGGGGTNNTSSNGGGYTPPSTNGTFNSANSPQVALPPISGNNAPSPTVAAPDSSLASPQSTLRSNQRPIAQEMTFQRVASTQIAWLAALLVACSLLLTQLRLGRRPAPSGAAAAKRSKGGAHRRPRNGAFGK